MSAQCVKDPAIGNQCVNIDGGVVPFVISDFQSSSYGDSYQIKLPSGANDVRIMDMSQLNVSEDPAIGGCQSYDTGNGMQLHSYIQHIKPKINTNTSRSDLAAQQFGFYNNFHKIDNVAQQPSPVLTQTRIIIGQQRAATGNGALVGTSLSGNYSGSNAEDTRKQAVNIIDSELASLTAPKHGENIATIDKNIHIIENSNKSSNKSSDNINASDTATIIATINNNDSISAISPTVVAQSERWEQFKKVVADFKGQTAKNFTKEFKDFCNKYKFPYSTLTSNYKPNGKIIFNCKLGGRIYKNKKTGEKHTKIKCGCPSQIIFLTDGNTVYFHKFKGEHNHPVEQNFYTQEIKNFLTNEQKLKIEEYTEIGYNSSEIRNLMNLGSCDKNVLYRIRRPILLKKKQSPTDKL